MAIHTRHSNYRSRNNRRQRAGDTRGVVLIVVMMAAVLLLIALTVTLPSVYQEGQREKEAELIFRGTQYARAVALFHKQFNRYPLTTKELLQTNGIRFLRQEYRDPMDPKGKWRFVHVNGSGMLLDSKNQPLNNPTTNPAGIGNFSNSSSGSSFMGNSNSMGFQGNSGGFGQNQSSQPSQIGPTSSFFGNSGTPGGGAFIAGVAALSHHESIRVWQKHHHYDEWEFVGLDMGVFGIQVGLGGGSAGPTGFGQQPQSPGSTSPAGAFGPTNSPNPPSSFGPSSNFGPSPN